MTQTGYCDTLSNFVKSDVTSVVDALKLFVPDAGESQVRAWRDSIRLLRQSVEQMLDIRGLSETASILLEYAIPLENRRIDALLLLNGVVVVVEFKGKTTASRADIDQAAAYARDLRAYHREGEKVPVK